MRNLTLPSRTLPVPTKNLHCPCIFLDRTTRQRRWAAVIPHHWLQPKVELAASVSFCLGVMPPTQPRSGARADESNRAPPCHRDPGLCNPSRDESGWLPDQHVQQVGAIHAPFDCLATGGQCRRTLLDCLAWPDGRCAGSGNTGSRGQSIVKDVSPTA
jgi:hypothetical protein